MDTLMDQPNIDNPPLGISSQVILGCVNSHQSLLGGEREQWCGSAVVQDKGLEMKLCFCYLRKKRTLMIKL